MQTAAVWLNLASAQQAAGQLHQAVQSLREALRLEPHLAQAAFSLGLLLHVQGQLDEAEQVLEHALRLQPAARPRLAQWFRQRGAALHQERRLENAAAAYRQAARWLPDDAEAWSSLGTVLQELDRFEEARASYEAALQRQPNAAETHHNLGITLYRSGDLAGAIAALRRAVELKPDDPDTHVVLGMSLLAQGDYATGWPEYEWRWRCSALPQPALAQPRWDGAPLAGRTILLVSEQGFGDTLQFIRFAEPLHREGATVLVQCQAELTRLLSACPFVTSVHDREAELPAFDVYAPLMSLPGLLHTTLDNLPAPVPYVHVEPGLVACWRDRLGGTHGVRVGIVWQGGSPARRNPHKAVALRQFEALARIEGVALVSVQMGFGTEQLVERPFPVTVLDDRADFADTAAVLANLDLVISIDTSVAHLAGALGRPTWVMLPADADWRWLRGRDDSPWYPTMRLFRQPRQGDWDGVFHAVAAALRSLVGAAR